MTDHDLDRLRSTPVPHPDPAAKARALDAAMAAFSREHGLSDEISRTAPQGSAPSRRLSSVSLEKAWRRTMENRLILGGLAVGALALPLALAVVMRSEWAPQPAVLPQQAPVTTPNEARTAAAPEPMGRVDGEADMSLDAVAPPILAEPKLEAGAPPPPIAPLAGQDAAAVAGAAPMVRQMAEMPEPMPELMPAPQASRDRFEGGQRNPVVVTAEQPVSTFSIDTDTASYAFARRQIERGALPAPEAVRVEEMINYFPYDYARPENAEAPFRPTVAVYPTPWNTGTRIVHIGIKGYDVVPATRPRANLVFLVDASGSMDEPDKLPLVKSSLKLLLGRLSPDDTVALVTYAGEAGIVLEPTRAAEREKIVSAVDRLGAGGSTAGAAGIEEAYRLARAHFDAAGVNRVILATDGDFNVGPSSDGELTRIIEREREAGVFLSVLGFGEGNYNDALMQRLAQNGNGTAAYIDRLDEAEKVLVDEATSTLFPVAKDVKIQVEFNPARVAEYRLIGYETRLLSRTDFADDRIDAGEVGSGTAVTALYEVTPVGSPARLADDLRYGRPAAAPPTQAPDGEYGFLKIRYKLPKETESRLIETPIGPDKEVAAPTELSPDLRFAAAVAAFGQKLRGDPRLSGYSYDAIRELAEGARGTDPWGYRAGFVRLVRLAGALSGR